jgi:triosephosphate isomerase
MMAALVVANWKMHGSIALVEAMSETLRQGHAGAEVVICPPSPYLNAMKVAVEGSPVMLGAQDCHANDHGAHTGDVSAPMLQELGCDYVIVGHSERRAAYAETDVAIAGKAKAALKSGITPIICVGESLEEREAGHAESRVCDSIEEILRAIPPIQEGESPFPVIAYEPIWAIGTGRTPTEKDVKQMHGAIHGTIGDMLKTVASSVKVLYGGSVKPENAGTLGAVPGVDGFLVGGASLEPASFKQLVQAAAAAHAAQAA